MYLSFLEISDQIVSNQKQRKLLANKILKQAEGTQRVLQYNKQLKLQQNALMHQQTLNFYIKQDPSFFILDRLRRKVQKSSNKLRSLSECKDHYLLESLPSKTSIAVKNLQRKIKTSRRSTRSELSNPFEYTCKQYHHFVL